jgi:hypothetical protein
MRKSIIERKYEVDEAQVPTIARSKPSRVRASSDTIASPVLTGAAGRPR